MKKIEKQIDVYLKRLNNLKVNRALECDTNTDAENHDIDHQIVLTAEFIRVLKSLKRRKVVVCKTGDKLETYGIYTRRRRCIEYQYCSEKEAKKYCKSQGWKVVKNFKD